MNYAEIQEAVKFCDSYTRLPTLMECYTPGNKDWFLALGENWSVCDNVRDFKEELRQILSNAPANDVHQMMTQEERKALEQLPDRITIYRGCYAWNRDGLSWSLSKDIAEQFTTLNRYQHEGHKPELITATVNKRRCILKLDREEQEIISWEASQ